MARYIRIFLAIITLATLFNFGVASAAGTNSAFVNDACNGLNNVSNTGSGAGGCSSTGANTVKSIASTVVEILSIIIGIVSVIVLIFAGFTFIINGGDPQAVARARNMIIYAVVGIAIAVLSQLIVREVTNTSNRIQQHSYLNSQSITKNDS